LLLGELVSNLLDNAIRYTQSGGNVTLRIREVGAAVTLEVEDNGPGIPQAERDRVFDRFYRAPGSDGGGSGLGLAIAREICRSQEATIELATAAGGDGLLVRVTFRAAGEDAATSSGSLAASA
ncbi:MAG TPA: sensor histidine kinase, partial [Usitatibacter sp.]